MRKYEILMFNMSNWSEWEKGVTNRNYQIFARLSQDKRVGRIIAVDYLPFSLKRSIKNYITDFLFPLAKGKRIVYRDSTTLCRVIKNQNPQIYHFSTIDSWLNPEKVNKKLEKILKIVSPSPMDRIIWSYLPTNICYFKIKNNLTVFDAVDNWLFHSSYRKRRKELLSNYKKIAKNTDIIFAITETLGDFFKSLGRKKGTFIVSNGVDYNHFQKKNIVFDEKFWAIPRPIIGYIGVIGDRIDFDLLEYLAKNNPQKSFVLIGPCWPKYFRRIRSSFKDIKRLKKMSNVYFLGPRPYKDSPFYIRHFDVGIIPHKFSPFIQYTSSLKLLEYLACGLPVVSTPVSGAKKFKNILYLASDYPRFSKMINLALKEDSSRLHHLRQKAAEKEDWKYKAEEMMKIIEKKIKT